MAREIVRDANHKIIAYIETFNGRTKITDAGSRTLGWYLPDRDVTTDAGWRVLGRGNQLLRLLPPCRGK